MWLTSKEIRKTLKISSQTLYKRVKTEMIKVNFNTYIINSS